MFWSRVTFSDEKYARREGSHCPLVKVTRRVAEKYHRKCIHDCPKRGMQLHVCRIIRSDGVGPILQISGNLNSHNIRSVIFYIDSLCQRTWVNPRRNFIFQEDNARAQAARSTSEFLPQKWSRLTAGAGIPESERLEHVLSLLSRRVRARTAGQQRNFRGAN